MSTSRASKKAVPRLRRSSNEMLLTPEEFDAAEIDHDLYIYELIRGVLIVSPRPSESERDPNESCPASSCRWRGSGAWPMIGRVRAEGRLPGRSGIWG
jgi:hypothetical protein